ncbi:Uncharacterised protein [uncultured Roseburia sp.]|nr:Uncharacterised protein [uncultured Roseburia sp.]
MEQIREILASCLNRELVKIIISNPRKKDGILKIQIRPVMVRNQLVFQASEYYEKKIYHQNLSADEMTQRVLQWMEAMKQMEVFHKSADIHILISKKGKITIKRTGGTAAGCETDLSHNRSKKYILNPAEKIPFLIDLGVQTPAGKIVHAKYDKFRQINRFLEFIQDIVPELPTNREAVILDFGCGKSYLTFAMYYYLHEI